MEEGQDLGIVQKAKSLRNILTNTWYTGMDGMDIRVDCYAGYRGEETPYRFWMENRSIEVLKVLDRWLAPDHRYFKLMGNDNSLYILRHDTINWKWELTFYSRIEPKNERRWSSDLIPEPQLKNWIVLNPLPFDNVKAILKIEKCPK